MASSLRLSDSFSKTKFTLVDFAVAAEEKCPLVVADGTIDWVDIFVAWLQKIGEFIRRLKGK